jgi:hypothetical protein
MFRHRYLHLYLSAALGLVTFTCGSTVLAKLQPACSCERCCCGPAGGYRPGCIVLDKNEVVLGCQPDNIPPECTYPSCSCKDDLGNNVDCENCYAPP